MSGYNWIGEPEPVDTSAPLFPEGSRKRYDPRAPSTGAPSGPPPGAPVVDFVGNADGSPAEAMCSNYLLLFSKSLTISGTANPYAVVKVYVVYYFLLKELIGTTQADASGAWSIDVTLSEDGKRCFAAEQMVPGGPPSGLSSPLCVMVGTCLEESPAPAIEGGSRLGRATGEPLVTYCHGIPLYQNIVNLYGRGTPAAELWIYLSSGPNSGTQVARTVVDGTGRWTTDLNTSLPEDRHCVVAVQQVPGWTVSPPSPEHCFYIGTCPQPEVPPQTIDTEAQALRYSPVENWQHGALAYKADGQWVYGVMRKINASPRARR
jgi:hypothetical protein